MWLDRIESAARLTAMGLFVGICCLSKARVPFTALVPLILLTLAAAGVWLGASLSKMLRAHRARLRGEPVETVEEPRPFVARWTPAAPIECETPAPLTGAQPADPAGGDSAVPAITLARGSVRFTATAPRRTVRRSGHPAGIPQVGLRAAG